MIGIGADASVIQTGSCGRGLRAAAVCIMHHETLERRTLLNIRQLNSVRAASMRAYHFIFIL